MTLAKDEILDLHYQLNSTKKVKSFSKNWPRLIIIQLWVKLLRWFDSMTKINDHFNTELLISERTFICAPETHT